MLQFSPYCAEFQIGIQNNEQETIVYPRRPLGELTKKNLHRTLAASALLIGVALYDDYDRSIFEYRDWLERILGYNLAIKIQPSKRYKKLYSAMLVPCSGPRTYTLEQIERILLAQPQTQGKYK